MAAVGSKRKRSLLNYKDLNEISSVVLYDTTRKSKGKFFEVDRLIEKRKVCHVSTTCRNEMFSRFSVIFGMSLTAKTCQFFYCQNNEYLVKWKGWPLHACSWEPEDHLTPALLRWMFALYNCSFSYLSFKLYTCSLSFLSFFFTEFAMYNR